MPNECFVIGPIGEADSTTRRFADQLFKYVIGPVVEPLGYSATRADRLEEPGTITTQIIQRIVDAPLVIADLTDHNPNVFYELALRHAIKKPIIQLIKADQRIPFDVSGTRTIKYDLTNLDSVDEAKASLEKQIQHLQANPTDVDTPISAAINLKSLEESDKPEGAILSDILVSLRELKAAVLSPTKSPTESFDQFSDPASRHRYPPAILEEIRARLPASGVVGKHVRLKKAGREWKGLSPFNEERTPSFYVNDQKQFYHCFSSGKHGDIFTFLMEMEGISFTEAVEHLAAEANVKLPPSIFD
jgi:hypothetical protein